MAGAAEVFTRYGFKKASMQDVADAAMMSRAALYLHFRNKDDLFRSLMQWHYGEALKAAEAAFSTDRPFIPRMESALAAFTMAMMGPVKASAYGLELFEANMMLAGDINAATALRLRALIENAVTTAVSRGEISLSATGLSAEGLTDLVYVCLDGIKKAPNGLEKLDKRLAALMRLLDASTRPA
ncbi:TetR/AcrR family transcriptional regulator [Pararhizobium sp. BT-229]|uniref:TetR/AcrR family transcriptional regulator n=1 Tax=Pararhizobium sp. BT-229 TaxID=2986923 RepID=UPI0021F6C762|nr:TetR/AcrR family transcriptional regulator [Pararhizobium sp. BT-229]MCV9965387.1 TetR/AcrR family transcriptional regulator [Pararhizobium sp. BT-229]